MLMAVCRWYPNANVTFAGIGSVVTFGVRVADSEDFTILSQVANATIVGRVLGGTDLGFFTVANAFGLESLNKVTGSLVHQLSLPLFSKLQGDVEILKRYFLKLTKYLAVVSFPVQIGLALVAEDLVVVAFSERWLPVASVLRLFALAGALFAVTLPCAAVLTARGKADVIFRYSGLALLVMALSVLFGTTFGLRGVAAAWVLAFIPLRLYLLRLSLVEIDLGLGRYGANLVSPAVATLSMSTAVVAVQHLTVTSAMLPLV